MHSLTVIHPFEDYQRGQKITDADEMERVLKGALLTEEEGGDGEKRHPGFAHHVVKTGPKN